MSISAIPSFGKITPTPGTLLMSDVDESFIYGKDGKYHTDELQHTVDTINLLQSNPQKPFYVWWNTVRVLDTIQKIAQNPTLKPILNHFFLNGLIVNNGKQMFFNKTQMKAADWIDSLSVEKQNRNWKDHIEITLGWKPETIDAIIQNILITKGFTFDTTINSSEDSHQFKLPNDDLRPPYQIWHNTSNLNEIIYYSPTHNALRLAEWTGSHHWQANNPKLERLADTLYSQLLEHHAQAWPPEIQKKIAHDTASNNSLSLLRLGPVNVNKATTTQFVINNLISPIKNVIVVGDDKPDEVLLTTDYVQGIGTEKTALKKKVVICNQPGRDEAKSPLFKLFINPQFPHIKANSGDISAAVSQAHQELTGDSIKPS